MLNNYPFAHRVPVSLVKNEAQYKKILVPFVSLCSLEEVWALALYLAEAAPAEIILLRMCEPAVFEMGGDESERLYSELKSLQARLQNFPLPAQIDTLSGFSTEQITNYARQHGVDLILMPAQHSLGQRFISA